MPPLLLHYCNYIEFAQVILNVEKEELGINAGLQDRVVQSYSGLVHMDFSQLQFIENSPSGIKVGRYTKLDNNLLPPLYLAYNTIAGSYILSINDI